MFGLDSSELLALIFVLTFAVIPGLIASLIAHGKGRSGLFWFFLGAIFPGFILLAVFMKPAGTVENRWKECPSCREFIHWESLACRYCDTQVAPA